MIVVDLPRLHPAALVGGGRRRASRRTAGRCVPLACGPVDYGIVRDVLDRPWRSHRGDPSPWRLRSLAALAATAAAPRGTTVGELCVALPAHVLSLPLSPAGRHWVGRWLAVRQRIEGAAAASRPWLSCGLASRGRPRMIDWAVRRLLWVAGAPAWSLADLLRASSPEQQLSCPR